MVVAVGIEMLKLVVETLGIGRLRLGMLKLKLELGSDVEGSESRFALKDTESDGLRGSAGTVTVDVYEPV